MSKKRVIAVVITTFALTVGPIGVAGADSKSTQHVSATKMVAKVDGQAGSVREQALLSMLKDLVAKGTLTQAQADSVVAAINMARDASKLGRTLGGKGGVLKSERAAIENLISTTIGIDTATIKSRLQAGESLAQIAGAKKDALITVLVADHTKRIDAAVTVGTITAAQAAVMKSKVLEHVTNKVNAVGKKHGFGKGGHGRGHGGHGSKGGATAPTLPPPAPTTGA